MAWCGRGRDSPGGAFLFTHQMVRRAIYDDLSEPRRQLMHGRVAEILQARSASLPSLATDIVHHAALAGDEARAARACIAAGHHCLRLFANVEAYALARRGLQHAGALGDPERTRLAIEAHDVRLRAHAPHDRDAEAAALEELGEHALELGLVEPARLGFHLVSYLRWETGDWSGARQQMLRAEHAARSADGAEQVRALAEAARCLAMLQRDLPLAEAMVLEARSRARAAGATSMAILDAVGLLRWHAGAWDEAAELFLQARDAGRPRRRPARRDPGPRARRRPRTRSRAAPKLRHACVDDLIGIASKVREGSEAPAARALHALTALQQGRSGTRRVRSVPRSAARQRCQAPIGRTPQPGRSARSRAARCPASTAPRR
jgi:hypothetical protein